MVPRSRSTTAPVQWSRGECSWLPQRPLAVTNSRIKYQLSRINYSGRASELGGIVNLLALGNESVPIQLAQCRFPGLAISNAKI